MTHTPQMTRRATDLAEANQGYRARDIKMVIVGITAERKRINEIVESFRASVMDGDELSELARLIDSEFEEPKGIAECEKCRSVYEAGQTCKFCTEIKP